MQNENRLLLKKMFMIDLRMQKPKKPPSCAIGISSKKQYSFKLNSLNKVKKEKDMKNIVSDNKVSLSIISRCC